MPRDPKSVLVCVTEDKAEENPSSALGYGLSLAGAVGAHLTVQAASLKLVMPGSLVGGFGAGMARPRTGGCMTSRGPSPARRGGRPSMRACPARSTLGS